MTREEFEDVVAEALDGLPEEIARLMDNIAVVVESRPRREDNERVGLPRGQMLLGLYHGVPLGERGRHRYGGVLPDRVTLYQRNIERAFAPEGLVAGIREVVLHEVGHHFGLSDDRLRQMGY